MSSGVILAVCIGLTAVGGIAGIFAGLGALSLRRLRRLLRGNLYEDYVREHEDICPQGRVACWKCQGTVVWVHILQREGEDVLSEHLCKNCGERLFYSVNGALYKKLAAGLGNS